MADGKNLPLESEVFLPSKSKSNATPCRKLWKVVIYDSMNVITKLEDLPFKGPFSATAVSNIPSDTKEEFLGKTIFISPILEYSLEYPLGKPAVVWLKSDVAFYQIMSVDVCYQSLWKPLKELLDMSGHTVNGLLKCGNDLSTLTVLDTISNLANVPVKKAVEVIAKGQKFIIDQIKNQGKPRLLKGGFFKDISDSKSWNRIYLSLSPPPEGLEQKPDSKSKLVPLKLKRTAIPSEPSLKIFKKTDEKEKIATGVSLPVDKPSRLSSADLSSDIAKPHKSRKSVEKVVKKPVSQKARRSNTHKSVLPCSYTLLEFPDEKNFDYTCPRCGLHLFKSLEFPKLLPRIQAHMMAHCENEMGAKALAGEQSDTFLKRHASFIKYVEKLKDEPDNIDYLHFPRRT